MWDENYESCSITNRGQIIANICVYKTEVLFQGKRHLALSLGAVATDPEFRGKGLARLLMEQIISKYKDIPMYLVANDGVLDFYPRFGFVRVYERQPVCAHQVNNRIEPRQLAFSDPKILSYVVDQNNFSEQFDCLNTASIDMFHIHAGYLKEHIYEIPELLRGPVPRTILCPTDNSRNFEK